MERLYKFSKNNIAYILQGGNGYYLTKNRDAFGEIDYVVVKDIKLFDMMFGINNAIELDDDGQIKFDNTELDTDSIMRLPLRDVIYQYRDDITYEHIKHIWGGGREDILSYNMKLFACEWNQQQYFQ
ncbi:hypothetical protein PPTG_22215 [Phytophthora nicotianae INRA-310]|uniref:Uncharacterized protein n=1 Tax=Phytophthora nicotianae (strain INRA-310) TaxID=761204 RepID=W2QMU1_PHYN3|nr:hypothetical protein PPTG_22215 [Phytophthora nicotianae INRA-310]ETN14266.1 hypothetical protein PPTG_22215 [Phytophthora nicotianae INRA-310]